MQSTHIANMNLPTISSAAKNEHVIPNLSSASFYLSDNYAMIIVSPFLLKKKYLSSKKNFCKDNEIISIVCGLF